MSTAILDRIVTSSANEIVYHNCHGMRMTIRKECTSHGHPIFVRRNPRGATDQGPSIERLFNDLRAQVPFS